MITAKVPRIKTLFVKPLICSAGTPKPTNKITKSIGIPRNRSTYPVAINLKGVNAALFDVRTNAKVSPIAPTQMEAIIVKPILVIKPRSILGSTSKPYAHLKNVFESNLNPGEVTIAAIKVPSTKTVDNVAIKIFF